MNFITVEEFKSMNPTLDISQYSDTTISGMISRATAKVENYIGYTLEYESNISEKTEGLINTNNDIVIFPNKYPVRDLASCSIVKGQFSAELNITNNYDIPSRGTEIVISNVSISTNTVDLLNYENLRLDNFYLTYTYSAGYYLYDRPQILIDAVNLYTRDEFTRSLNAGGAKQIRQGGVTISYDTSDSRSDFINDADTLLSSLKRVTGF